MTQKQILAGALIVALGMVALPRPAFAPSVSDLADELNVLRAQLSDQQRRLELETQVKLNTLQEKLDDLRQRLSSIEWGQEKKLDALERRLSRIELFSLKSLFGEEAYERPLHQNRPLDHRGGFARPCRPERGSLVAGSIRTSESRINQPRLARRGPLLFNPTSTVLRKMVAEIRGIAGGATGRAVMWC